MPRCSSLRERQEESCLVQREREAFKRYDAPSSWKGILENTRVDTGLGPESWVCFLQVTCLLHTERIRITLCQEMR